MASRCCCSSWTTASGLCDSSAASIFCFQVLSSSLTFLELLAKNAANLAWASAALASSLVCMVEAPFNLTAAALLTLSSPLPTGESSMAFFNLSIPSCRSSSCSAFCPLVEPPSSAAISLFIFFRLFSSNFLAIASRCRSASLSRLPSK